MYGNMDVSEKWDLYTLIANQDKSDEAEKVKLQC